MKLKNSNFFERHVEHLVLGLAFVFLLAVLYLYVFSEPYALEVKVGAAPAEKLEPGQLPAKVAAQAKDLERKIEDKKSPLEGEKIQVPNYTVDFVTRLKQPMVNLSISRLPPWGSAGLDLAIIGPGPEGVANIYALVTPPAPADVSARTDFGVLAETEEPERQQELIKLVGDQKPRDFNYVTVAGTFNVAAYKMALRYARNGTPVPPDWWQPTLFLTDVELQRQTLDPLTGQWGENVTLEALPGEVNFRDEPEHLPRAQAMDLVANIRQHQEEIARPAFVALTQEQPWLPPGVDRTKLTDEQQAKLKRVLDEIRQLERDMAAVRKRIATVPPPGMILPPVAPVAPGGRPGGGGAPGGRPGPAPAAPGGRPINPAPAPAAPGVRPPVPPPVPAPPPPAKDPQIIYEQLRQQKDLRERERDMILGLIPTLPGTGADALPGAETRPAADVPPPPMDPVGDDEHRVRPLSDKVQIWAHDITVKPGMTYRYRMLVRVINPLYQRANLLPAQAAEADRLARASEPSPWIEVKTYPVHRFFVTGASPDQQLVTFQIWRIFNGHWRSHVSQVRPGDPIGKREVKFTVPGIPAAPPNVGVPAIEALLNMSLDSVLVDMVPGGLGNLPTRILYMTLRDGRLHECYLEQSSAERTRLENEERLLSTMPRPAATPELGGRPTEPLAPVVGPLAPIAPPPPTPAAPAVRRYHYGPNGQIIYDN